MSKINEFGPETKANIHNKTKRHQNQEGSYTERIHRTSTSNFNSQYKQGSKKENIVNENSSTGLKNFERRSPRVLQQDHQVIYTQNINFFSPPPTGFTFAPTYESQFLNYSNYTDFLMQSLLLQPVAPKEENGTGHDQIQGSNLNSPRNRGSEFINNLGRKKGDPEKEEAKSQLDKVRQAYLSPAIKRAQIERNELKKKKIEEVRRYGEELEALSKIRKEEKDKPGLSALESFKKEYPRPSSSKSRKLVKKQDKFYLPMLGQLSHSTTATPSNKQTNTLESRSKDFSNSSQRKQISLISSLELTSRNFGENFSQAMTDRTINEERFTGAQTERLSRENYKRPLQTRNSAQKKPLKYFSNVSAKKLPTETIKEEFPKLIIQEEAAQNEKNMASDWKNLQKEQQKLQEEQQKLQEEQQKLQEEQQKLHEGQEKLQEEQGKLQDIELVADGNNLVAELISASDPPLCTSDAELVNSTQIPAVEIIRPIEIQVNKDPSQVEKHEENNFYLGTVPTFQNLMNSRMGSFTENKAEVSFADYKTQPTSNINNSSIERDLSKFKNFSFLAENQLSKSPPVDFELDKAIMNKKLDHTEISEAENFLAQKKLKKGKSKDSSLTDMESEKKEQNEKETVAELVRDRERVEKDVKEGNIEGTRQEQIISYEKNILAEEKGIPCSKIEEDKGEDNKINKISESLDKIEAERGETEPKGDQDLGNSGSPNLEEKSIDDKKEIKQDSAFSYNENCEIKAEKNNRNAESNSESYVKKDPEDNLGQLKEKSKFYGLTLKIDDMTDDINQKIGNEISDQTKIKEGSKDTPLIMELKASPHDSKTFSPSKSYGEADEEGGGKEGSVSNEEKTNLKKESNLKAESNFTRPLVKRKSFREKSVKFADSGGSKDDNKVTLEPKQTISRKLSAGNGNQLGCEEVLPKSEQSIKPESPNKNQGENEGDVKALPENENVTNNPELKLSLNRTNSLFAKIIDKSTLISPPAFDPTPTEPLNQKVEELKFENFFSSEYSFEISNPRGSVNSRVNTLTFSKEDKLNHLMSLAHLDIEPSDEKSKIKDNETKEEMERARANSLEEEIASLKKEEKGDIDKFEKDIAVPLRRAEPKLSQPLLIKIDDKSIENFSKLKTEPLSRRNSTTDLYYREKSPKNNDDRISGRKSIMLNLKEKTINNLLEVPRMDINTEIDAGLSISKGKPFIAIQNGVSERNMSDTGSLSKKSSQGDLDDRESFSSSLKNSTSLKNLFVRTNSISGDTNRRTSNLLLKRFETLEIEKEEKNKSFLKKIGSFDTEMSSPNSSMILKKSEPNLSTIGHRKSILKKSPFSLQRNESRDEGQHLSTGRIKASSNLSGATESGDSKSPVNPLEKKSNDESKQLNMKLKRFQSMKIKDNVSDSNSDEYNPKFAYSKSENFSEAQKILKKIPLLEKYNFERKNKFSQRSFKQKKPVRNKSSRKLPIDQPILKKMMDKFFEKENFEDQEQTAVNPDVIPEGETVLRHSVRRKFTKHNTYINNLKPGAGFDSSTAFGYGRADSVIKINEIPYENKAALASMASSTNKGASSKIFFKNNEMFVINIKKDDNTKTKSKKQNSDTVSSSSEDCQSSDDKEEEEIVSLPRSAGLEKRKSVKTKRRSSKVSPVRGSIPPGKEMNMNTFTDALNVDKFNRYLRRESKINKIDNILKYRRSSVKKELKISFQHYLKNKISASSQNQDYAIEMFIVNADFFEKSLLKAVVAADVPLPIFSRKVQLFFKEIPVLKIIMDWIIDASDTKRISILGDSNLYSESLKNFSGEENNSDVSIQIPNNPFNEGNYRNSKITTYGNINAKMKSQEHLHLSKKGKNDKTFFCADEDYYDYEATFVEGKKLKNGVVIGLIRTYTKCLVNKVNIKGVIVSQLTTEVLNKFLHVEISDLMESSKGPADWIEEAIKQEKIRNKCEAAAYKYLPHQLARVFLENIIQVQGLFENEIRIPPRLSKETPGGRKKKIVLTLADIKDNSKYQALKTGSHGNKTTPNKFLTSQNFSFANINYEESHKKRAPYTPSSREIEYKSLRSESPNQPPHKVKKQKNLRIEHQSSIEDVTEALKVVERKNIIDKVEQSFAKLRKLPSKIHETVTNNNETSNILENSQKNISLKKKSTNVAQNNPSTAEALHIPKGSPQTFDRWSLFDEYHSLSMKMNSLKLRSHQINSEKKKTMTIAEQVFFSINHNNLIELEELLTVSPSLIDLKDKQGNSLLMIAVISGNIEIVRFLISLGATVTTQNLEGNSALHYSIANGYDDISDELIAKGANAALKNKQGKIPWDFGF